ncbi:ABC transporter permease [Paenibacillus humicola]|uniref:ABC transporter permease n=1 Tax=Paenibacillus humicola TaxID=3110540 RepID=UPI00237A4DBA|nr:ABC transporter permease [Paenibacillus humicola]
MRIFFVNRRNIHFLYWLIAVYALWEAAAWGIRNVLPVSQPGTKWPYISHVIPFIIHNLPQLLQQGGVTFLNAVTGFFAGSLVGLALAVIMSLSKTIERTITPYIVSSQMVPIIGLAPIIFGILHNADLSRITMAAYVTFFPVTINSLAGLSSVRQEHKELLSSYACPTWKYYWKLALPSSLPQFFLGLKLSAPLSITASIVVELMGAPNGIGVLMVSSLYYGTAQSDMFWATVFFSAVIGLAAFLLISVIERLVTPWQPEFRERGGRQA